MNSDNFPILDVQELVTCLQECDFSLATVDNIERPSSQFAVKLFKQIIDTFMGISPDSLLSNKNNFRNLVPDQDEDESEDGSHLYADALNVMALNRICYKFFKDIGVADFNVMDLYKPEPYRTRRILSAVANYARFREEAMLELDGGQHPDGTRYLEKTDTLLRDLRGRFDQINALQGRIQQLKELQNVDKLDSLEKTNKNLESELKHLNRVQEALTVEYERYKVEKQALLTELESLGYELIELESTRDKLKKYTETDLNQLNKSVDELNNLLGQQQEQLAQLEQSQKSLTVSLNSIQSLTQELFEVLQIVSTDLQDSHLKEGNLLDTKHKLLQNTANLNNLLSSGIMAKISLLQEQLDSQKQKLSALEQSTQSKEHENSETLKNLRRQHTKEVLPEVHDVEKRYTTEVANAVSSYNAQMKHLRDENQREVDAIDLEYSLLANHIKNYMDTINERIK
ncbi:HBR162Cp [Eremothecium sinecaudum]|uniref:HBR162Cp n=1 Tax=Eremothecium sinecaudum TaxID=45286 RepID=A0A109UWY1_9SACH|nr:HBR162Cp [Eremothecium sinecaudum]AMD19063.1 HBR162Cp [Eremothecium sinecaudum]